MLEIIINDTAKTIVIPTQENTALDATYLLATEDGEFITTEEDQSLLNMKTTWK